MITSNKQKTIRYIVDLAVFKLNQKETTLSQITFAISQSATIFFGWI
jgi:acyl CoA:acetate/3-ketoacid CoA transferase